MPRRRPSRTSPACSARDAATRWSFTHVMLRPRATVTFMNVTVLGAGSWGTTVASLVAGRNPTVLWARNADVADSVNKEHMNEGYLPGCRLSPRLRATSDLEEAVSEADLLVVGVPTQGFR